MCTKVDLQIAQCAHGVYMHACMLYRALVGASLSGPHTNQYYEKTAVLMYVCMYVCI